MAKKEQFHTIILVDAIKTTKEKTNPLADKN